MGFPFAKAKPANACGCSTGHAAAAAQSATGAMPLHMARSGDSHTVSGVRGQEDVCRHLAQLGFVPGSQCRVVCTTGQNCIVEVKGARVALEGRLAKKVMVE